MKDKKEEKDEMSVLRIKLGTFESIPIYVNAEYEAEVDLNDLSPSIKHEIKSLREKIANPTVIDFEEGLTQHIFEIPPEEYKKLVRLNNSIIKKRSIDNETYLQYLFQSLTKPELKEVCKNHDIKGYSKYNKQELIEFLLLNLAEEEQKAFLLENEKEIILKEIKEALRIIYRKSAEKIVEAKVINEGRGEIELTTQKTIGENTFMTTSYVAISQDNTEDPERDCDCRVGGNNGFCPHFWILLFQACKHGFFTMEDWKLTYFPNASLLTRLRDEVRGQ